MKIVSPAGYLEYFTNRFAYARPSQHYKTPQFFKKIFIDTPYPGVNFQGFQVSDGNNFSQHFKKIFNRLVISRLF